MKKTFGMNRHQKAARRPGELRLGRDEIPLLLELASSEDPADRLEAAQHLCPCHVRKRIETVWKALFSLMEDPDVKVRRAAWHTLEDGGNPTEPALGPILERTLKSEKDPTVLGFARQVAARKKTQVQAPPLSWRAVRKDQCDFCGETRPVDYDLQTTIPSTRGTRQALVCEPCHRSTAGASAHTKKPGQN